jgi:quercetin dioxygenase-like cupin family protein
MHRSPYHSVIACILGIASSAYVHAGEEQNRLGHMLTEGTLKVESKFNSDVAGLMENHALSMLVVTVAANSREPAHTHPGDEILFGLSGKGAVYIDGVRHGLEPGAVVLVRRGQKKALSSEGEAEPLRVLACLVLERKLPTIELVKE